MSKEKNVQLLCTSERSAATAVFCERYQGKIKNIESVEQRNNILSEMQQDFEEMVIQKPYIRNELSEAYQLLKRKCWEVRL